MLRQAHKEMRHLQPVAERDEDRNESYGEAPNDLVTEGTCDSPWCFGLLVGCRERQCEIMVWEWLIWVLSRRLGMIRQSVYDDR